MAEAHGQLTGRPAACLGTRAVGAANLAIGIHTARQDSTPMFALVGQVERAHRGHEAFQEIDQVATIGGLAKWAAEPDGRQPTSPPSSARRSARSPAGARARCCCRCRRTCSTSRSRRTRASTRSAATGGRPSDDDIRAVIELLASAERPVILAGGGVLRARTSTDLLRFAELLQVPIVAAWRRADVISNDHPLYLGMAGLRCRPHDPRAAGGGRRDARHRLPAERADVMGGHDPGASATRWAHVDIEPHRVVRPATRATSRSPPTRARSCARPTIGWSARPCSMPSLSGAARPTTWRTGPPGRPPRPSTRMPTPGQAPASIPGRVDHDAAARPARRRDPHHGRRQLRRLGRSRLPVPPTRDLHRPDVRCDGLRGPGRDRGGARPSRSTGRGARRRRRDGDDDGRAGDGDAGGRPRSSSSCSTTSVTGPSGCGSRRRGTARASPRSSAPVDFAAIARGLGARGVRVDRDADLEPALRQALAEERSTVIQLALDRAWVSVDQPATW